MIKGKDAYLKRLVSSVKLPAFEVGRELEGSSPPSLFVGSYGYPKVYAGPMIAPFHGDTAAMDSPESWIPSGKSQDEIIRYRLSLIRGKSPVNVNDLDSRLVEKITEIALSSGSVESHALFERAPKGATFSDHHAPFGPSGALERLDIDCEKWDRELETAHEDIDLRASEAITDLHRKGVPVSSIQKALSAGALGMSRSRRLVPTRWAITACDSAIADSLLHEVQGYEPLTCVLVYESGSLNNYYAVMLLPGAWQYEWMEAFLHLIGREELIFSDYETFAGKRGYSRVGGCYYASKMAVLEGLSQIRRQAAAIVFREAYRGYVPMGVFNVRENIRNAMIQQPTAFEDMRSALEYLSGRLTLPVKRFWKSSTLMNDLLTSRQTTLSSF